MSSPESRYQNTSNDSGEHGPARNIYQARKKKKSFIKGLLVGESKSQRKAKQISAQQAGNTAAVRQINPEAESVYRVDVDDRTRSVVSEQSEHTTNSERFSAGFLSGASNHKAYMLKVVLLLMDPETRRFELLQLEFDSDKALVSDVLTQIPVAVTEEVLKQQRYVGISGSSGTQMNSAVLLSEFCKGNDVLVAVPDGVPAVECARLARPILNDDKVIKMLKSSGIDASSWSETKPRPAPQSVPARAPEKQAEEEKGGGAFALVFLVLVAVLLQLYHAKITAPIAPGQLLSPGGWVSRCGLTSILPVCESKYMHMGDDGILSLVNANGELEWEMKGAVCESEGCTAGMEMKEDGRIVIGGKHVPWVNVKKESAPIAPWPFAEQPKLKVIRGRK